MPLNNKPQARLQLLPSIHPAHPSIHSITPCHAGYQNPQGGVPRHFAHFQHPLAQLTALQLKPLWLFETTAFRLQTAEAVAAVTSSVAGPGSFSWRRGGQRCCASCSAPPSSPVQEDPKGDGHPAARHHWDPQVPAPLCVGRDARLGTGMGVRRPQNRSAHSFNIVTRENGE